MHIPGSPFGWWGATRTVDGVVPLVLLKACKASTSPMVCHTSTPRAGRVIPRRIQFLRFPDMLPFLFVGAPGGVFKLAQVIPRGAGSPIGGGEVHSQCAFPWLMAEPSGVRDPGRCPSDSRVSSLRPLLVRSGLKWAVNPNSGPG